MIKSNKFKLALILAIIATLLFIFINSFLPADVSSEESDTVSGWLEAVFPSSTTFGRFILDNVRKIAHFVEYGVLGAELTLYVLLFERDKRRGLVKAALLSFFTAFVDETIQIFSGRGPMISDVWLDFLGALSAIGLCLLIYFLIIRFSHKGERGDIGG